MVLPPSKTKIVCTIGPASESPAVMEQLLLAGMNVARLNFSHGDFSTHGRVIEKLRAASVATGRPLAILADLPGPKIRIGQLEQEPVELRAGELFILTAENILGDVRRVSVSFTSLPQVVRPGDTLFLNDGLIQLQAEAVQGQDIRCRVIVGGELRSRKGINLPGIDLGISAFTEHDHDCLKFALERGVDAVSQSFVNRAEDILAVRSAAEALGNQPFIIAKIERSSALEHIEEIMEAADGIMIARGDLGVELPIEQIPILQKRLMRQAMMRGKPVITATQMLESMTQNRRPTRAEATDVANAILDGTDCVMLSGESAMGMYPVESVEMLVRIAAAIEEQRPAISVSELFQGVELKNRLRPAHLIVLGVERSLEYATPAAVFVPTRSGATARRIASFRLPVWIIAISAEQSTCQRLLFSSGVWPINEPEHPGDWTPYLKKWVAQLGLTGDLALLTEGPSTRHPEANNRLEIIDLNSN